MSLAKTDTNSEAEINSIMIYCNFAYSELKISEL